MKMSRISVLVFFLGAFLSSCSVYAGEHKKDFDVRYGGQYYPGEFLLKC